MFVALSLKRVFRHKWIDIVCMTQSTSDNLLMSSAQNEQCFKVTVYNSIVSDIISDLESQQETDFGIFAGFCQLDVTQQEMRMYISNIQSRFQSTSPAVPRRVPLLIAWRETCHLSISNYAFISKPLYLHLLSKYTIGSI